MPTSTETHEWFDRLFSELVAQTENGDENDILHHPHFREIVRMRGPIIRLVLQNLQRDLGNRHVCFQLLRVVSGFDPVRREERGIARRMTEAWLLWGRQHGYLPSTSLM